ncbi:hypothetical protein BJV77DRAFT_266868 [Russula vinacea]|nr:hypothetical protein BJV77DRAFT_266868 [Russula vinacea]
MRAVDDVDGTGTVNFDRLPFLNAVIKEDVSTSLFRTFSARRLGTKSYPCTDKSFAGPAMSSKSSAFLRNPYHHIDVANRDIWGEDAGVWRPSRWLDGSSSPRESM